MPIIVFGGFLFGGGALYEAARLNARSEGAGALILSIGPQRCAIHDDDDDDDGLGCPDLRGVYGDRGSGARERAVDVPPRYSLMDLRLGPGSQQRAALTYRRGEHSGARWSRAGTPGAPSRIRVAMNDVGTT